MNTPIMTFKNKILEVTIQSHHSEVELMMLKEDLKNNYNVDLDFTELEFDSSREIEKIRIAVDTNRGESGSASSTDSFIQSPQVFFMVNYNAKTDKSFEIGGGRKS